MATASNPEAPTKQQTKNKPNPAGEKSQAGLWTAFAIGAVLFAASAAAAWGHTLAGQEARLFYDINNIQGNYKTVALLATEGLGAAYPIAICVVVAALLKKYRLAWRFFFTVGGALAVAEAVKFIIKEPRPVVMLHGQLHQRAVETGPSFPSNHAAAATALALTLWFVLPAKWRWLSVLWIAIVAWSRLYLGVHTPADVVGGFAIGLMAVCFVRLLPKKIAEPLRLDEA